MSASLDRSLFIDTQVGAGEGGLLLETDSPILDIKRGMNVCVCVCVCVFMCVCVVNIEELSTLGFK